MNAASYVIWAVVIAGAAFFVWCVVTRRRTGARRPAPPDPVLTRPIRGHRFADVGTEIRSRTHGTLPIDVTPAS